MKKCSTCGAPIDGSFCSYCGSANNYNQHNEKEANKQPYNQQPMSTQPIIINNIIQNNNSNNSNYAIHTPKNKMVALFLCIFLGYWGAHKFYLGKSRSGFVYLFTAGLLGIGWIVDIFLILTDSSKDKYGYPLA